jgi:hypothetical protein
MPRTRSGAGMLRYHFVSVDGNDEATTIQTIGCEDDSIACRQTRADALLADSVHAGIEVCELERKVYRADKPRS